jgi:transketolase
VNQAVGGFTDSGLYGSQAPGARSYGRALFAAACEDERIVCLGADLTRPTETALFRERMPQRFFSLGIQEANMIGVAAGMARCGDMPFVHSFCVFATRRVYDQVAMQVAYPRTNVKIVGFIPGLTTSLGVSHQAIDDVALMRALPNMTIIEPAGPAQIQAAVRAVAAHQGPVYLRMPMASAGLDESAPLMSLELGRGQILTAGTDIAILASGTMVDQALHAGSMLADKGVSATVANIHTIKPLDHGLVERLAGTHRAMITAENHSTIGGLGAAVAEQLALSSSSIRFGMIGVRDIFAEGASMEYLMRKFELDADAIADKALSLILTGPET